jgi:hypothetical protein
MQLYFVALSKKGGSRETAGFDTALQHTLRCVYVILKVA